MMLHIRKVMLQRLSIIGMLCGITGQVEAGEVVDQSNPFATLGGLEVNTDSTVAQTFTVGVSGTLTRIVVFVNHHDPGCVGDDGEAGPQQDLVFDLVSTSEGAPTPNKFATVKLPRTDISPTPGGSVNVDLSSFGISVSVGDVLGIVLTSDAPSGAGACRYAWAGDIDTYAGGQAFINESAIAGDRDMSFQTFVERAAVPPEAPIVKIDSPIDGASYPVKGFTSLFGVTCRGGPHRVEWGFDNSPVGKGTFHEQVRMKFIHKLAAGRHSFWVRSDCGKDEVRFKIR